MKNIYNDGKMMRLVRKSLSLCIPNNEFSLFIIQRHLNNHFGVSNLV